MGLSAMGSRMNADWVLGIWDGHDAGAALLKGDRILVAVNEERYSRRKLEAGFPTRSINACLSYAGISPGSIQHVAISTSDPAKTLTRLFPGLKEAYYLLRRRKKDPGVLLGFKKWFKYRATELHPNRVSGLLTRWNINRSLKRLGVENHILHIVDHHEGHAQAAARCSGFRQCLVITLDGVGDGLCGSIRTFIDGRLDLVKILTVSGSLGIFFEHVTSLMNMRELEDEGKVMALADYAHPVDDSANPLMELIHIHNLDLVCPLRRGRLYREMKKIFWRFPSEQFAYMAQRVVETKAVELIHNAVKHTGLRQVAAAGGLFSNVKLNMKAAQSADIDNFFVFPHMGDGGLAIGSALAIQFQSHPNGRFPLSDLYLGPAFSARHIQRCLEKRQLSYRPLDDKVRTAAELILKGEIILWFQGRMELGPRALGNRSILARADDRSIRDRLNLALKKRVWYQPFCPSLLEEDAAALLDTKDQFPADNRFMTSAFSVRPEKLPLLAGVVNIDGTCRPQFVAGENSLLRDLLLRIKEKLGYGVVLNTSFNIHGQPIVCSPEDALDTLLQSGFRYLILEDYLVENAPV
jgi:carbamoyltransferase